MPSAGEDHSAGGDGSDEATDSEDLGVVDRNRRRASKSGGGGGGGAEESRRMFQKLWTDADEMKVLQGFYEFTSRRGTTHANYQHDTGPFFDEIRPRLHFDFNKNQIVEKLRRLKKKYRNAAARIESGRGSSAFKSPHDRSTYDISRKIWSSTFKRKPKNPPLPPPPNSEAHPDQTEAALLPVAVAVAVAETSNRLPQGIPILLSSSSVSAPTPPHPPTPSPPPPPPPSQLQATKTGRRTADEDALRICLAPLFKELLQFALDGVTTAAAGPGPPAWMLPGLTAAAATGKEEDERWRRQRILELELYLKRVDLVEETVRSALERLRSMGS